MPDQSSPYAIPNVRLFIAFKCFFNARFYYPVFTILFLDFGLTVSQFALLNAVWAATIVIMEVPSGALADIWGRRRLMVLAGGLMVLEMMILCFAPRNRLDLLFGLFVINRILSGVAEAAASGADEAMAYDALKRAGREEEWGRVLSTQMRLRSLAAIVAMSLGAAVYDPAFMQRVFDGLGIGITFTRDITIRIPLVLTLMMSLMTFMATLRMQEDRTADDVCGVVEQCGASARNIWLQTMDAGKWILKTPIALVIICAGLLFDSIMRMVITLNSQYYRVIEIPEAAFGLIGAGIAGLGLFLPRIALKMSEQCPPRFNLAVLAVMTIIGLYGMSLFIPIAGLVPAVVLFSAMYMTGFFVSNYLNRITASSRRATVLSFKGLSFNLSYGLLGILYSVFLAGLRPKIAVTHAHVEPLIVENMVFMGSFKWFLWAFVGGLVVFLIFSAVKLRSTSFHREIVLPTDKKT
ncbi:MAG: MFS transporter [Thermodesulfobacteriota bacterium]